MLLTNIAREAKAVLAREGVKQQDIATNLNKSYQAINRTLHRKNVIPKAFIEIFDAIGYDIEVTFIKKENHSV